MPCGKALQVGIDISSDYYLKGEVPRDIIANRYGDSKSCSTVACPCQNTYSIGFFHNFSSTFNFRGREVVVYLKDEIENDPDKLGNATLTGANFALWLFVGPIQSKVVVEIGRA